MNKYLKELFDEINMEYVQLDYPDNYDSIYPELTDDVLFRLFKLYWESKYGEFPSNSTICFQILELLKSGKVSKVKVRNCFKE